MTSSFSSITANKRARSLYPPRCTTCWEAIEPSRASLSPPKALPSSRNRMRIETHTAAALPAVAFMACSVAAPAVSQDDHDYQRKVRTQLSTVDTKIQRGPFHAD